MPVSVYVAIKAIGQEASHGVSAACNARKTSDLTLFLSANQVPCTLLLH